MPRIKRFISEVMEGRIPQTLWTYQEVGHTQDAKKEMLDVLQFPDSASVFSTPKPLRLLERIIRLSTGPDDIVMDFFAGSGTTGHAVLKLNSEEHANRRFILVSNSEATVDEPTKNLCRDVCAERMRKVIGGYTSDKGEHIAGLGGDFAYLRCRRIPAGRLTEIDHAQVWTALQLIHRDTLKPFEELPLLVAGDEDESLLYVPKFRLAQLTAIRDAVMRSRAVILYSWQPELLRQQIGAEHVQFEHIPDSLARRFGLKG